MNRRSAEAILERERMQLRKAEMAAFDALPKSYRRALAKAHCDWRATDLLRSYKLGNFPTLESFVAELRLAERDRMNDGVREMRSAIEAIKRSFERKRTGRPTG